MSLDDSKLIFEQIAHIDAAADAGTAVRAIIENHDAWSHSAAVLSQLCAACRVQIARTPRPISVSNRIALQQSRLAAIAVTLPARLPAAG